VPKETTVIGVPGREVVRRTKQEAKRHEIAEKMGFDAYGSTEDMPDPVANSMNRILDHIHLMDERIEDLCEQVRSLGGELDDEPIPALETECFSASEVASEKDKKSTTN
jgi:serine O-acetyltransferase